MSMISREKLAFSTLGCPELSFEEILQTAQQHQIKHIELRGILDKVKTDTIPELLLENRAATAQKLATAGADLCVLGCSATFHKGEAEALAECAWAIEAAKALHVPYIRVFGERSDDDSTLCQIGAGLAKACQMAKGSGVRVLLETHGNITTALKLKRLLHMAPELGLIWDVLHTHRAGEEEQAFAKELLPHICHVHLKNINADGRLCLSSEGTLPLRQIVYMLSELGYEGLFSLEWERRWHQALPDIHTALDDYIKAIL